MLILIAGKALNPNWVLLTQEKLIKCTLVLGRLLLRGRDYNPKRVVKIETFVFHAHKNPSMWTLILIKEVSYYCGGT